MNVKISHKEKLQKLLWLWDDAAIVKPTTLDADFMEAVKAALPSMEHHERVSEETMRHANSIYKMLTKY